MGRKSSTPLPEYVAKAATTPPHDPDLLDELSFEHRQIQRLWSELQLAHRRHVSDDRPAARYGSLSQRALGQQIVQALARLEATEVESLYPAVTTTVGQEWADHAAADQAEIRDLLDEVDGEDPEDEEVFELFTEVLTKVLAHIDEEEKIIFPMMRAVLPSDALLTGAAQPAAAAEGEIVDLAAAEREIEGGPASSSQDRKSKIRRRLLRR